MSIGDDLEPHRRDIARLVVQGAVGPFDRLFEASRREMSQREAASDQVVGFMLALGDI